MASVAALMTALPMECSPSRKLHPSDLDQDLVTDMPEAVASTNKRKTLRSWLASWRFPASNTAAGRRGNSGNGRLGQEVDAGKSPLKWTCKFATPKRPKATKDDTSPAIFTTHTAAATSSSISTPASQSQVLGKWHRFKPKALLIQWLPRLLLLHFFLPCLLLLLFAVSCTGCPYKCGAHPQLEAQGQGS